MNPPFLIHHTIYAKISEKVYLDQWRRPLAYPDLLPLDTRVALPGRAGWPLPERLFQTSPAKINIYNLSKLASKYAKNLTKKCQRIDRMENQLAKVLKTKYYTKNFNWQGLKTVLQIE